jgi:hypothetical protein
MDIADQFDVATLVPIYKPTLSAEDTVGLRRSLDALKNRRVTFIHPKNLELTLYRTLSDQAAFEEYDESWFSSIANYNRLLLAPAFYQRYQAFEFILILQTDAVVLRDDLQQWLDAPFDYVGAPWPNGYELFINLDRYSGSNGKVVKAHVGNGGLSLRRVRACLDLMTEFPQALDYFQKSGSSEDLFFAFMGQVSQRFVLPSETRAALFSLELHASKYFAMGDNVAPLGGHAWSKYEPQFWAPLLDIDPSTLAGLTKAQ